MTEILTPQIEQIPQRELGRLGSSVGGGLGARLGAKLLKTKSAEASMTIGLPSPEARQMLEALLQHTNVVLETGACSETRLMAVARTGALNMNSAVLLFELNDAGRNSCACIARAFAKEGLINQCTSEKAINRVVEGLSRAAGSN